MNSLKFYINLIILFPKKIVNQKIEEYKEKYMVNDEQKPNEKVPNILIYEAIRLMFENTFTKEDVIYEGVNMMVGVS